MTSREISSNVAILFLLGAIMYYFSTQNFAPWVVGLLAIVMVIISGKMVSKVGDRNENLSDS